MQTRNIDYQEERVYAGTRLIILFIFTLSSFIISTDIIPRIPLVRLVLGGMILLSIAYNTFIAYKPDLLVPLRKNVLIFVDLLALTLFILIFEKHGVYLFALYVLIVMQSSLYFGARYAYTSLVSATAAWVLLYLYSPYWHTRYDIIIAFAITAFLTTLFSIRFIGTAEETERVLTEAVIEEQSDEKNIFLASMPNREKYKEVIQDAVNRKETFSLLFISLDKFQLLMDKHGVKTAEKIMEEAARRLKNSVNEDDFIARLGGGEFVIISKQKRTFLKKYLKKLEESTMGACKVGGINALIKINIGVSFYPESGQTVLLIGKCANDALRAAKENNSVNHMIYGNSVWLH